MIQSCSFERKPLRHTFTMEFECGGKPYVWTGSAASRFDAEAAARSHLYMTEGLFHNPSARLVRVEVAA